ncbi:hypothetical protein PSACC_00534 [Paramicrosporidium saccamoebae]|uniref:Uncharacterized protein n=1 Tax=Paramicrosporidium saccamoebae TaxID=1246581 RepID=A0A2H9TPI1_9FUNG|nr:hypothetical protein PSACC_00534 [Paramicrosporidium saccamoebae]
MGWKSCELLLTDRQTLFGSESARSQSRSSALSEVDSFPKPFSLDPQVELDGRSPFSGNDFEIDFGKIESRYDLRTTCMIRNIPNKYTQVSIASPIDCSKC